jgi:hypothetical protein
MAAVENLGKQLKAMDSKLASLEAKLSESSWKTKSSRTTLAERDKTPLRIGAPATLQPFLEYAGRSS